MKKALFIFVFIFAISPLFSQSAIGAVGAPFDYDIVQIKPEFPGGNSEFMRFIVKNFQLPEVEGLSGEIKVRMTIV